MGKKFNIDELRKYVNGELSHGEMYAIERAAQDDEQLLDVITGLEYEKDNQLSRLNKSSIEQSIQEHIASSKEEPHASALKIPFWKIASAAVLLIGIGIVSYLYINNNPVLNRSKQISENAFDSKNTTEQQIFSKPDNISSDTMSINTRLAQTETDHSPSMIEIESKTRRPDPKNTVKKAPSRIQLSPVDTDALIASTPIGRKKSLSENDSFPESNKIAALGAATSGHARILRNTSSHKSSSTNIESIPSHEIKSITTGIVLDKESNRPIEGAIIEDLEGNNQVYTDSTGLFVIASTEKDPTLNISSIGFESARKNANGSMRVELSPQSDLLDEVVVGYGTAKRKSNPEPVMGKSAYRNYINKMAKESDLGSGQVTVEFQISTEGKPENIRIIKSGGSAQDKKAIQLIQQGPNWIPAKNLNSKVEWKVIF